MKPKPGTVIIKTPLANCWLEGHVLCIVPNEIKRTVKNTKEHYVILNSVIKEKVIFLVDLYYLQAFDKEVNSVIIKELPKICRAMALLTDLPYKKLDSSLFDALEKKGVLIKLFDTGKEARAWAKKVLKDSVTYKT